MAIDFYISQQWYGTSTNDVLPKQRSKKFKRERRRRKVLIQQYVIGKYYMLQPRYLLLMHYRMFHWEKTGMVQCIVDTSAGASMHPTAIPNPLLLITFLIYYQRYHTIPGTQKKHLPAWR